MYNTNNAAQGPFYFTAGSGSFPATSAASSQPHIPNPSLSASRFAGSTNQHTAAPAHNWTPALAGSSSQAATNNAPASANHRTPTLAGSSSQVAKNKGPSSRKRKLRHYGDGQLKCTEFRFSRSISAVMKRKTQCLPCPRCQRQMPGTRKSSMAFGGKYRRRRQLSSGRPVGHRMHKAAA